MLRLININKLFNKSYLKLKAIASDKNAYTINIFVYLFFFYISNFRSLVKCLIKIINKHF